jgi:predicted O-methyltransferase YrrM
MIKPLKTRAKNYLKQRGFYQDLLKEKESLEETKRNLEEAIDTNKHLLDYKWFAEPGHFYSPLIDEKDQDFSHLVNLWDPTNAKEVDLPGIELNTESQLALLKTLSSYSDELTDYLENGTIRFRTDNDQFGHSDRSFLYLMLRHAKPKKIIEVGSGWTSALMLDVNEHHPKQAADLTFVEPYPERLYSAIKPKDKKRCTIITDKIQTVDVKQFEKLKEGDLLFIDNSHVSKTGSDVNFLFFEVLPRLKKGVIIHIHDVFYPFEYPIQWVVEDKRNWNEAYALRALLTGSNMFEIMLWPSYLLTKDTKSVQKQIPAVKDFGSSIWLRKT